MNTGDRGGRDASAFGQEAGRPRWRQTRELGGLPGVPRVSGQVKQGLRGPGGFSRVKGKGIIISN